MPLPFTRPITRPQGEYTVATLHRPGSSPALALPPSSGTTLPRGAGVMHTVKDPAQIMPRAVSPRVTPAAVT